MSIKTYRGRTLNEVLAFVRRDLGDDAVVLHTRTAKAPGLQGFMGQTIVEVTASDTRTVQALGRARAANAKGDAPSRPANEPGEPREAKPGRAAKHPRGIRVQDGPRVPVPDARARAALLQKAYAAQRSAPTPPQPPSPGVPGVPDSRVRSHLNELLDAASPQAPSQNPVPTPTQTQTHAAAPMPSLDPAPPGHSPSAQPLPGPPPQPVGLDPTQFAAELAAVRGMVERMAVEQQRGRLNEDVVSRLSDPLADHYLALLEQEVEEELVVDLVSQVKARLSDEALADADACRAALHAAVAELIPVAGQDEERGLPARVPHDDGRSRPRVIAFVGPTGVGKTTTVAKLAATYTMRHGRRVGLISTDDYRVGATGQLAEYAEILGLTMRAVRDADTAASALNAMTDVDVVLVDTSGVSPKQTDRIAALEDLLGHLRVDETHLVLASNVGASSLKRAIETFERYRPGRLVFTKLDEAVTFGVLLNVTRAANKRLSFVTAGQEVPADIAPADAREVARLLIGERDHRPDNQGSANHAPSEPGDTAQAV